MDGKIIRGIVQDELVGFEERLSTAMTKALDIVVSEIEERLETLEEDVAHLMRYHGLE